ncbi:hypothetical protein BC828DRAFT_408264 [Blastocladiella britannica]|nr:hypothetical protein BC828DRAFT_408264 [Blastocladiella britannica]
MHAYPQQPFGHGATTALSSIPADAAMYIAVPIPRAPGSSTRTLSASSVLTAGTPAPTPTGAPGPSSSNSAVLSDYYAACDAASDATGAHVLLLPPSASLHGSPTVSATGHSSPAQTASAVGTSLAGRAHPDSAMSSVAPSSVGGHMPEPFVAHIAAESADQAMRARAEILYRNPARTSAVVRVSRPLLLSRAGELHPGIKADVQRIQEVTGTQITVLGELPSPLQPPPGIAPESTALELTGSREAVYAARIQLLVALDMHAGLFVDSTLDLDPKCHYVVAGRKAADLHNVMRVTNTNVYLPSPFAAHAPLSGAGSGPGAPSVGWETRLRPGQGRIWITGDRERVQQAHNMLMQIAAGKKFGSRQLHVLARKLDWMLTHRKDLIMRFMYDNGTFVALPPLGSGHTLVTVYGDNMVSINRTLESVARLACDCYSAEIRLLPMPAGFSSIVPQGPASVAFRNPAMMGASASTASIGGSFAASTASLNPYATPFMPSSGGGSSAPTHQPHSSYMSLASAIPAAATPALAEALAHIAQMYETETVLLAPDGVIEIHGSDLGIAAAFEAVVQNEWVARSVRAHKFRIELDIRHKEFISGKKNGKINKIIKASDAAIVFDDWNDVNMIIEVGSPLADRALEGFALLRDELPAEISFHVPEVHHKRIIGVAGKNIQRIMKKYGVFVKFSNSDEHAAQGGYFDNDDNVIARTPAKNSASLVPLKRAILESIVLPNAPGHSGSPSAQYHTGGGGGTQGFSSSRMSAASPGTASTTEVQLEPLHFLTCLPIRYHRWVTSSTPGIEAAAVVTIRMPNRETGSDEVMIAGHEANVKFALLLLAECTPETYNLPLPRTTAALSNALRSPEFSREVVEPAKIQYEVEALYVAGESTDESTGAEQGGAPRRASLSGPRLAPYISIRCPRKSVKFLPAVHQLIEAFADRNNLGDALYLPPPPEAPAPASAERTSSAVPVSRPQAQQQQQSQKQPLGRQQGGGSGAGGGPAYPATSAAIAPGYQRRPSVPGDESVFRAFNAKLFSSTGMADAPPSSIGGGAPPMHGQGPPAAAAYPEPWGVGGGGGGGGGAGMVPRPPMGHMGSHPTLRELFDNPASGQAVTSAASGYFPGRSGSFALRDVTDTDAYAHMISPTTAAELPFLAPDSWQRQGGSVPPPPTFEQQQQQQLHLQQQQQQQQAYQQSMQYGTGGAFSGSFMTPQTPYAQQQQQHQEQQEHQARMQRQGYPIYPLGPMGAMLQSAAGVPYSAAGGPSSVGGGQSSGGGAGSSGLLAGRGIFELGSLVDSLPQASRSPPNAPARPTAKTPSPLLVQSTTTGLSVSPPTPLSLSGGMPLGSASLGTPTSPASAGSLSASAAGADLTLAQLHEILSAADPVSVLCRVLRLDDKYDSLFHQQEVDMGVLLQMTDAELRDVGVVAFGPRKKLVGAISELNRYRGQFE